MHDQRDFQKTPGLYLESQDNFFSSCYLFDGFKDFKFHIFKPRSLQFLKKYKASIFMQSYDSSRLGLNESIKYHKIQMKSSCLTLKK